MSYNPFRKIISYQNGEISLTLSILAITISLIGLAIGSTAVRQQQTTRTLAESFPYESILELRDENGNVVNWESGMRWKTNIQGTKNEGDIRDIGKPEARLTWQTASVEPAMRNIYAEITAYVPTTYEITGSFCEDRVGNTCAASDYHSVNLQTGVRNHLKIEKDARITYGWIVRRVSGGQCEVTDEACKPSNVTVNSVTPDSVSVSWQYPQGCRGYQNSIDPFWIDVVRKSGFSSTIVCSATVLDNDVTCRLGTDGDREIDKNSSEWKNRQWNRDIRYSVNVYTRDRSGSCVSAPGFTQFTYDMAPTSTPAPSGTPTPTPMPPSPTPTPSFTAAPTVTRAPSPTPHPLSASDVALTAFLDVGCDNTYTEEIDGAANDRYRAQSNGGFFHVTFKSPNGELLSDIQTQAAKYYMLKNIAPPEEGRPYVFEADLPAGLKFCRTNKEYLTRDMFDSKARGLPYPTVDFAFDYIAPSPTVTPTPTPSPIPTAPTPPRFSCSHVKGAGSYRIAILPAGFSDYAEFLAYARSAADSLQKTNANYLDNRFTYVMHNDLTKDYECRIEELESGRKIIRCNDTKTEEAANECGMNTYIVIFKSEKIYANAYIGYSVHVTTGIMNLSDLVVAHELGHAIPELYDEYVYYEHGEPVKAVTNPVAGLNCAAESDTTCSVWDYLKDPYVGCFEGCTYSNWRRSSTHGIMNGFRGNEVPLQNLFNRPSLEAWNRSMANYQTLAHLQTDAVYHNSVYVSFNQVQENTLVLNSAEVRSIYPEPEDTIIHDVYYTLSVKDGSDKTLFSTQKPKYLTDLHEGPVRIGLRDRITAYLPYYDDAQSVIVTDENGAEIVRVNLKEQSLAEPAISQNLCGNSYCDIANGEDAESCRADCGPQVGKSEDARSDLDNNGVVNALDLAILIDAYGTPDADIDGDNKTNAIDYSILLRWIGTEVGEEE